MTRFFSRFTQIFSAASLLILGVLFKTFFLFIIIIIIIIQKNNEIRFLIKIHAYLTKFHITLQKEELIKTREQFPFWKNADFFNIEFQPRVRGKIRFRIFKTIHPYV
jgi:hypothetical protein